MVRVTTFFGTDRVEVKGVPPERQFSNDDGPLKLGYAELTIPLNTHVKGEIESTPWYRAANERKDMLLRKATAFANTEDFVSLLKKRNAEVKAAKAFVFIHGYNVSFEDAALRTAQISYDLGFNSIPAFYSWASHGRMFQYTYDETNIERTLPKLVKFLTVFGENATVEEIYVVAHSMGTRAATRAMVQVLNEKPELKKKYKELILAAPDIDAGVFQDQLLPALLAADLKLTLYASSNDRALWVSKGLHKHQRLGDSLPTLLVVGGVETLDASQIDTDFLGHSYFATSHRLLEDLSELLNQRARAAQRKGLATKTVGPLPYWEFISK